eukprot:m.45221 g.45221  ORF g.45221 m.45221 type:complete len:641 (-) comp6626_c0_seq1:122-2044(-)
MGCLSYQRSLVTLTLWATACARVPYNNDQDHRYSVGAGLSATNSAKPHILMVCSDDLGYNDVSFHGSEVQTPFLDSLVEGGLHFDHYYGHAICTPSRSAIMSGRFASHTGMQHSFLLTGTDVNLPIKFKTLANHMNEQGYSSHMVGKWHLGFESASLHTPLARGFSTYFGYLSGGEDYYTHKAGGFVDLHNGTEPVLNENGSYSTILFADEAIRIIRNHNDISVPFFMYLAFQSVHSPLQAPADYISHYNWINNTNRRTLAAMTTCMDDNLERIVTELKDKDMWSNTLFLFFADNGGPPYVANSNWPMRGGKWTMWEGGTHLTAFAHHGGGLIRTGNFTGLMHHCDWAATLVAAAGGTMNDTALPAPDSISQWPAMLASTTPSAAPVYPREHVLLNVDQTNQEVINDAGGWSGYAGIVRLDTSGYWKLVLGNPGTPNDWCWPNQEIMSVTRLNHRSPEAANCSQESGVAFPGNDISHVEVASVDACCPACSAVPSCIGYTFRPATTPTDNGSGACWLKFNISTTDKAPCPHCVSGTTGRTPLPPNGSDPMPNPADLTCAFNGHVPANKTGTILFDLRNDPLETTNVADQNPDIVAALRTLLDGYIASAVEPLNETPDERKTDPAATAAAKAAQCWVPWEK